MGQIVSKMDFDEGANEWKKPTAKQIFRNKKY